MADATTKVKFFFYPPGIPINITQEMKDGILLLANSERTDCQQAIQSLSKNHFATYGACASEFNCKKFKNSDFNKTDENNTSFAMIAVSSEKKLNVENRSDKLDIGVNEGKNASPLSEVQAKRRINFASILIETPDEKKLRVVFVSLKYAAEKYDQNKLQPLIDEIKNTQKVAQATFVVLYGATKAEHDHISKSGELKCIDSKRVKDDFDVFCLTPNSNNTTLGELQIEESVQQPPQPPPPQPLAPESPQGTAGDAPIVVSDDFKSAEPMPVKKTSSYTFSKIFWRVLGALLLVLALVGAFVHLRRKPSVKA